MMTRDRYIAHVTNVITFLVWQEKYAPDAMYGARSIRDAINSFCAIIGADPVAMREGMLLDPPKPGDDRHA